MPRVASASVLLSGSMLVMDAADAEPGTGVERTRIVKSNGKVHREFIAACR